MKKILLLLLCMLFTAKPAAAYVEDKVLVMSESSPTSEAKNVTNTYVQTIARNMGNRFRCLTVITTDEITSMIGWARKQQLMGTVEEQQIQLKEIGDAMGVKYTIRVNVVHAKDNPQTMVAIKALNNKNQSGIYNDTQIFSSPEAAWDGANTMFDRLVKGFSEHLSMQKGGYGEICPFTGRVDVYREVKRARGEKSTQTLYCNGGDWVGHELESYAAAFQEVWSLERFGNPDTKGGVEATFNEKTVREEVNPCYVCGPDDVNRWVWNRTATVSGAINGLSAQSAGETIKNEDATIRLHFTKDGTYTVTVKVASEAGTLTKTVKESAIGMCNTFTRNEPPTSEALKLGFEYTFGPFAGTPFATELAEKLEVNVPLKEIALDTKEETVLRIDFALERPGN